ncbi:MAG: SIMPL domain-containing protein [Bacteroidota bacterium]|nr:SIMPL domain-containing protein [Bacteroidota bacterium]
MRRNIMIAFILCLAVPLLQAQSTDRFIRIVGNAKKEYVATGIVATVAISEQQPNEYKQVPYMPFEAVYTNYLEELFTLGVVENQLVRSPKNMGKFNATTTKEYVLRLNGVDWAEKITSIRAPGVQITELKYSFTGDNAQTETLLAKSAIDDARRKAQSLCTDLKMKLGKILNIEDTSSGCCNTPEDAAVDKIDKVYKINVTFELIDP